MLIVVDWSGMSVMLIWLSWWLDPNHRTSVFVGLSFSLLADIQSLMAVTHAVNLWTASAASSIVVLMYIWLSSAYWWKHRPCWVITWLSSAVYKTYNSGSSTEPCGTPNNSCWTMDACPLQRTCCVRPWRKLQIHSRTAPAKPNPSCSLCNRRSWSTQSNAADMSSKPNNVTYLWSAAILCYRVTKNEHSSYALALVRTFKSEHDAMIHNAIL